MSSKKNSKTPKNFFERFMDGFISALIISGNSDLFLGIFIVLEGICLILVPSLFSICIIIGTVIGFTWLIELVFDIISGRKKIRNAIQQICIILIMIVAGFFLVLMLIDQRLVLNVDRIAVCVTTIVDGFRNLIDAIKSKESTSSKILIGLLCLVYINYGLVYAFLGGDGMTSFFTTGMHGVVFIFLGLTDLWFYFFVTKTRRLPKLAETSKKKKN